MSFLLFDFKASGLQRQNFLWSCVLPVVKGSLVSIKRLLLIVVITLVSLYMFTARDKSALNETIRMHTLDVIMPIIEWVNRPIESIQHHYIQIRNYTHIQRHLEHLEKENFKLEEWKAAALQLRRENKHLRELLRTLPSPNQPFRTAKVLGSAAGAEYSSFLVAATKKDGVQKNSAVLCAKGVVGRIADSGAFVSRVVLLTDIQARTPIRFADTGEQAILAGTGTHEMIITHRQQSYEAKEITKFEKKSIAVGDSLVTSGFGGIYPPDLPVATVVRIDNSDGTQKIYAEPIASPTSLEFVRILDPLYVPDTAS